MRVSIIGALLFSLFLSGCGGQSGGFAPSKPPIKSPPEENNFKYGETKQTANGWQVSLDTTDPVQTVSAGNGWTVEVKHE